MPVESGYFGSAGQLEHHSRDCLAVADNDAREGYQCWLAIGRSCRESKMRNDQAM